MSDSSAGTRNEHKVKYLGSINQSDGGGYASQNAPAYAALSSSNQDFSTASNSSLSNPFQEQRFTVLKMFTLNNNFNLIKK
jgi:hypothetical protein